QRPAREAKTDCRLRPSRKEGPLRGRILPVSENRPTFPPKAAAMKPGPALTATLLLAVTLTAARLPGPPAHPAPAADAPAASPHPPPEPPAPSPTEAVQKLLDEANRLAGAK